MVRDNDESSVIAEETRDTVRYRRLVYIGVTTSSL